MNDRCFPLLCVLWSPKAESQDTITEALGSVVEEVSKNGQLVITLKAPCQFKELIIGKQKILKFNWQKQTSKQKLSCRIVDYCWW